MDERSERDTIPIRPGEDFDRAAVEKFLRANAECPEAPLEVEQFGTGSSNLTYLLRVGESEWVLRRPPLGPLLPTAHDMMREYRVLSALAGTGVAAPRPLAACEDTSLIGAPFYIMERLHGFVIMKGKPSPELDSPQKRRAVGFGLVEALARLHGQDYRAIGLAEFGRPEGFVERQVRRWRKQWLKAKTRELQAIDDLDRWLTERVPASSRSAIVHGDSSTHNALFDRENPGRVVALLDWEMSTLGDPLCDLGYLIALWPQEGDSGARAEVTNDELAGPELPTRAELTAHYERASGNGTGEMKFYETLALYKLAIILEGIYSRYAKGQTRDPRFAVLEERVIVTAEAAMEAAEA